jgi:hypothetical protein
VLKKPLILNVEEREGLLTASEGVAKEIVGGDRVSTGGERGVILGGRARD